VGDLTARFVRSIKLVDFETLVDVGLLILLFRRNSGTYPEHTGVALGM
jgi:hypothetical protein